MHSITWTAPWEVHINNLRHEERMFVFLQKNHKNYAVLTVTYTILCASFPVKLCNTYNI